MKTHIRLEYFTKDDFNDLINWVDSEHLLMNWTGSLFKFPLDKEKLDWYIEGANENENSEVFIYKAVDVETGESLGHISLGNISKKNRSGRISRVLVGKTKERKKGLCKQMVSAVLKIGFEDLKLHRISLGVYDFNISAMKCYEKCGMKTEGTNRDILLYEDEWWSMIEMSMLEPEWRKLQKTPH